ncbi:thioesterase II family protein [Pedobacter alluvionis]|uniref:Thioesterase n=1 Tax=Pedobacter alluvionis TaxID=475253 RepID=A0A497XVQ5_9SPHI|nr:alpha/beta fold hydrolase [Pedobacter alluvionis]RLJ72734.1 surfactin synthase thioesterase subunit [Pedobacter alluvionis]TFB29426.1 thioesterase [Pedobacter alluvionis]
MKKPQLFLLHFAGGNCHSFQFLLPYLNDFSVIPLELPGRGKRVNEDLLTDFDTAAQDILKQLISKLSGGDFLIYGHSMGAKLTLRVANLLENAGIQPAYLIVSGNAGPGISEGKTTYLLDNEGFMAALAKLGGVPAEVMEDKELMEFFEPILRTDFKIAENNNMKDETPVNTPLFAMMGTEEEHVNEIRNWKKFTTSTFEHQVLEGNHFFIHQHSAQIAKILKQCYAKYLLQKRKQLI